MSKLKLIAALAVIVFVSNAFSQSNGKLPGNEQGFYSTSDGTTPTDKYSVQPKNNNVNPEVTKLVKELNAARRNGNTEKVNQLQLKLNELSGARVQEGAVNSDQQEFIDWSLTDYNVSTVLPWNNWGSALGVAQTGPVAGRMYAASTQWTLAGGDTMTFLTSTNGGQTWTRNWSTNFVSNTDYNANEIDIEIVYDGTNTWAFIVAGYYDYTTSTRRCWLWRYNITANALTSTQLVFAPNPSTNDYYCPRITSDGSVYTSIAYVYVIASCDSTYSGTNHWLKQKFCYLANPFSSITLTYKNPNANGGWFYNSTTNAAGKYLSSDIAYLVNAGLDRVITSFQVDFGSVSTPSGYNIVTAWSDDYGTSNTGNFQVAEANTSSGAKISFPGANSNYGMLVYQRSFNATDWDPYFRFTSNRGSTWSTGGYVDASGDRQRGRVEVYTPYPPVSFRVGYNQEVTSAPQAFLQKFDTTSNTFPSGNKYQVSNVTADTAYGSIRPAKKTTGADDCVAIWRGLASAFTYCSYNCATTVGVVNNNQTPTSFDLSQNYPNPFNPSTNIKFAVPVSGMVKLVVYDVTGREAGILLSEQMNAGTYSVNFDASQLSSGIYFYTLTAGDFTQTKKMMLIK